ncbi:MAG TPA: sensor histidine kinase [Burkholderiaceae bacterium]
MSETAPEIAEAKMAERARIARDLHDAIGGNLAGIKMALAVLARDLPQDSSALHEKAAYVDELIDRTIDAVHRLSADMAPASLRQGLTSAIRALAEDFSRQSEVQCQVIANAQEIDPAVSLEHATALLRIFQEALTNVSRHARAAHVQVRMALEHRSVRLVIEDDGKGIQPADRGKADSLGIRGMIERAQSLGGDVSLHAVVPHGTAVIATFPVIGEIP